MANITKTVQTELLGITAIAANAQQISSVADVSTHLQGTIFIDHARDAATAFVGSGTEYRVEVSEKDTGNDTWRTLTSVAAGITAASSIATDAEEAAGQTVIECGATVPAVGDKIFFKNAVLANSEWGLVVARVTTGGSETFTLQDALTNTQAAGTYYTQAEQWVMQFDLASIKRLRVVVNNNKGSTNQAIVARIALITADSIG